MLKCHFRVSPPQGFAMPIPLKTTPGRLDHRFLARTCKPGARLMLRWGLSSRAAVPSNPDRIPAFKSSPDYRGWRIP